MTEKNPITDRDLGLPHAQHMKYARTRAIAAEEEQRRKARRDKHLKRPKYSVDERVVVLRQAGKQTREYRLAVVVDVEENYPDHWQYYAVVLRSSSPGDPRLGRLMIFDDGAGLVRWSVARVPEDSVRWMAEVEPPGDTAPLAS